MELLQSNKPIIGNTIYANTKWYDNRCVQLLSNIVGTESVQKVRRYNKKDKRNVEISYPNAIVTYNKFMGGVDVYLCFTPSSNCFSQFHTVPWQVVKWQSRDKDNVRNVASEQRTLNFL